MLILPSTYSSGELQRGDQTQRVITSQLELFVGGGDTGVCQDTVRRGQGNQIVEEEVEEGTEATIRM